MDVCGECGVPLIVGGGLKWEGNGVITLAISPVNRMVFYESGNIDNLFRGIEELIRVPIEHIVIESRRRETRRYIEKIYSGARAEEVELTREGLREKDLPADSAVRRELFELAREINLSINDIGRAYGYGDIALSEGWERGGEGYPWRSQVIRDPYSVLFYAADMLGSVEAIEGTDHSVTYREREKGLYEVTSRPGSHPIELRERLRSGRYAFKPGDIAYERCPGCGLPEEITRCAWDLERGTITDSITGRRMAIFGPASLDAILYDLEAELGEAIPQVVIAAQRNYVRRYVGGEDWNKDASSFRRLVALRGLGNLVRFEGGAKGLSVTIENSCLHLPMVGTVQAMVEMVYGVERSSCRWSLAQDGDLTVEVEL